MPIRTVLPMPSQFPPRPPRSGHAGASRRGFAIPVAILLIAVLSISLGAGFMLVNAERRSVSDDRAEVDALRLAEQGMQIYLVRRDSLGFYTNPPVGPESTRVTLSGGYADVILTRVYASGSLYVVRSRGVQTSTYGNIPQGVRTITQYVTSKSASFKVRGAWTALNGVNKNGASGTLNGNDACGDSATTAGLALPRVPGYTQTGTNSGNLWPNGNPDTLYYAPTADSAAKLTTIDWNSIVNGNAITPDVTYPQQAWPSFSDTTYWPIIVISGTTANYTLPTSGRGLLIVQGSLTMDGSTSWSGLILIGGELISNGNNTINGSIISGLNVKLDPTVGGQSSLANGTKTFQYNSCSVAKALGGLGRLTLYANTWSDSWPGY